MRRACNRLKASIIKHGFKLFVIDTIAPIRPVYKGLSASEADAKIIRQIVAVARSTKCCIVVMTQANKRGGEVENIGDRIGHTNQFAAAGDDLITLFRKKNDATRRRYLECTGRNVQESDEMILTLTQEGLTIPGRTYDILMSETQRRIIDCLKFANPDALTPNEIAKALNDDNKRKGIKANVTRENVKGIVARMISAETVVHVGKRGQITTPTIAAAHWAGDFTTQAPKVLTKVLPKVLPKVMPKVLRKGTAKGTDKGTRGVRG